MKIPCLMLGSSVLMAALIPSCRRANTDAGLDGIRTRMTPSGVGSEFSAGTGPGVDTSHATALSNSLMG